MNIKLKTTTKIDKTVRSLLRKRTASNSFTRIEILLTMHR